MEGVAWLTQAEIALTGRCLILQGFKCTYLSGYLQNRLPANAMGQFRGTE